MINIDVSKLKEMMIKSDNIIEKVEKIDFNVVHEFNKLSKLWNDNHSIKLYESFNLEKNRYFGLQSNIKSQINIYKLLIEGYSVFGKKIKCDEENSSYVLYKIDIIIEKLNYLIFLFDNIGDISFYAKSQLINDEKDKIKSILEQVTNLRNSIDNEYKYINTIEKNVSELLEKFDIEKFVSNNYECEE